METEVPEQCLQLSPKLKKFNLLSLLSLFCPFVSFYHILTDINLIKS